MHIATRSGVRGWLGGGAALALLVVLGTSACGSDDAETSAGGQSGGSPDSGVGNGGTAGAGGAAGAAGEAGSSAGAGSGGDAGQAGAAGTAGAPGCAKGTDCEATQVCDPATLQCIAAACEPPDYESCADNPKSICLEQDNSQGACYPACKPFDDASPCAGDSVCIVQSDDETRGLCYHPGTAAAGSKCEATDTSTGCVSGAVCVNLGSSSSPDRKCATVCQLFGAGSTGCNPTELCMPGSVCLPSDLGIYDQVAIGEECTLGDYLYCGESGGRLTGICDDAPSSGKDLRCYKWCRLAQGNSDCPATHTCTDTDWGSGLGVCVGP